MGINWRNTARLNSGIHGVLGGWNSTRDDHMGKGLSTE